jgi:hypothetical protein
MTNDLYYVFMSLCYFESEDDNNIQGHVHAVHGVQWILTQI